MKKLIFLVSVVILFADTNSLVQNMCKGIDYYRIDECPMDLVQFAIKKGVVKIEEDNDGSPIHFNEADAFYNEDKVYPIFLTFEARLDDDAGLFVDKEGRKVYIEDLPSNVRFYPKAKYIGFVRGEGAYKLTFPLSDETYEMIPKGEAIVIKRETKIHWN